MSRQASNPRPDAELVGAAARRVFLLCCPCGCKCLDAIIPSCGIAMSHPSPSIAFFIASHRIARVALFIASHPSPFHIQCNANSLQFNTIASPLIPTPRPRLMPPTCRFPCQALSTVKQLPRLTRSDKGNGGAAPPVFALAAAQGPVSRPSCACCGCCFGTGRRPRSFWVASWSSKTAP